MQDKGRGDGVNTILDFSAAPSLGVQCVCGCDCGQAFVPKLDGYIDVAAKLFGVVAHPRSPLAFLTTKCDGQADDHQTDIMGLEERRVSVEILGAGAAPDD